MPPGKSWWGRGLQALRLAGPAVGIVLFVPLSSTILALAPTSSSLRPSGLWRPLFSEVGVCRRAAGMGLTQVNHLSIEA